jgi:hypothetical protein
MGRARHYSVYVIELSKDVLNEGRFVKGTPDYVPGRPCVYVGMTSLDPDVRFDKHKAGIQHNTYVLRYECTYCLICMRGMAFAQRQFEARVPPSGKIAN